MSLPASVYICFNAQSVALLQIILPEFALGQVALDWVPIGYIISPPVSISTHGYYFSKHHLNQEHMGRRDSKYMQ